MVSYSKKYYVASNAPRRIQRETAEYILSFGVPSKRDVRVATAAIRYKQLALAVLVATIVLGSLALAKSGEYTIAAATAIIILVVACTTALSLLFDILARYGNVSIETLKDAMKFKDVEIYRILIDKEGVFLKGADGNIHKVLSHWECQPNETKQIRARLHTDVRLRRKINSVLESNQEF